MKKIIRPLAVSCLAVLSLASCQKNTKDVKDEIPQSVMAQISRLGFSTENVSRTSNGYLVEGDIVLTENELAKEPTSPNMVIAQEEQYRTFNLVSTSKHATIKVALSNSSAQHDAAFSAALDEAIRRYNAEGLTISF